MQSVFYISHYYGYNVNITYLLDIFHDMAFYHSDNPTRFLCGVTFL